MGNRCSGLCEGFITPHQRLRTCRERCSHSLSEGFLDSETVKLLMIPEKENCTTATEVDVTQCTKKLCHGIQLESRVIDPRLLELCTQKIVRMPFTVSQLNGSSASGLDQRGPLNREGHRDLLTETKSTPLKMQPPSGRRVVPELHFYIVTWNMNGKPPLNSLENILDVVGEKYDFYVIGFQEAPNFSAEALITQALEFCDPRLTCGLIAMIAIPSGVCVAAAILTSLQLFVFAKKSLQPHITGPRVDKVGVGGFGTVVGRQKGAAAVAFYYKKVSLLFITSHLSPHECNMEERNAQYTRICQTIFARQAISWSCIQMSTDVDEPYCKLRVGSNFVEKTDVVIWLGDLNYRVELPRSSVGFLISHNLEKVLWAKDQLSRAVQRGEVFKGFQEGPLLFPPTYKYDIGTDNYDTSSKERVPSWTDRILYKVTETSFIKANLQGYTSINSVKTSDHRPVKAHLTLINMKNSS